MVSICTCRQPEWVFPTFPLRSRKKRADAMIDMLCFAHSGSSQDVKYVQCKRDSRLMAVDDVEVRCLGKGSSRRNTRSGSGQVIRRFDTPKFNRESPPSICRESFCTKLLHPRILLDSSFSSIFSGFLLEFLFYSLLLSDSVMRRPTL